jgi:hypothetical protein
VSGRALGASSRANSNPIPEEAPVIKTVPPSMGGRRGATSRPPPGVRQRPKDGEDEARCVQQDARGVESVPAPS